ncbi:Hypothetical predicted protein [Octopus vulgaris]|uniref:Uncharacterized protein n=1 Tax=Octopus vulgaris TaxID=6645 RepID=A0AA36B832_OCTVU|nr:Hypothetical predicted protein [Octopus vulgaris]
MRERSGLIAEESQFRPNCDTSRGYIEGRDLGRSSSSSGGAGAGERYVTADINHFLLINSIKYTRIS